MVAVKRRVLEELGRFLHNWWVERWIEARSLDRPRLFDQPDGAVSAVYRFGNAGSVSFEDLDSLDPTPAELLERPPTVDVSPWTVCECPRVQLIGPEGLTVLSNGDVLLENSLGWTKRVAVSAARSIVDGSLPVRRDAASRSFDAAVSLVGPWTDNYYHWHIDYLCRLGAFSEYVDETGRKPPLLLPPETSGWMLDALSLVGYDETDWVSWDGRRTDVNLLVVPTLPRETQGSAPDLGNHYYSVNPAAVQWLGARMRSNVTEEVENHAPESGRLFVSRQGATERRITNLDEIEPVLDEYGFERFRPEEYSVAEQVRAFASIDVVLGVHGAGLTNVLFSEDVQLLELFGDYVNPAFYALAVQTGSEYACAAFESRGRDVRVDPERLRRLFELGGLDPIC